MASTLDATGRLDLSRPSTFQHLYFVQEKIRYGKVKMNYVGIFDHILSIQITIFEQYEVGTQIVFSDIPDLGPIAGHSGSSFVVLGSILMKLWILTFIWSLF